MVGLLTETTGTRYDKHDIIQMAGCFQLENGDLVDWFDFKMKPLKMENVDPYALVVNGTDKDDLVLYPDAKGQLEQFLKLCSKYVKNFDNRLTIGGYNVKFDITMLQYELFKIYGDEEGGKMFFRHFTPRYVDAYALLPMFEAKTGKIFKSPKLTELYEVLFGKLENAHDAKADIIATIKIYYFFQKLFINK